MNWLGKLFNKKDKEVEEVIPPYEMTVLDKQTVSFIEVMIENIKDVERTFSAWNTLYNYCDTMIVRSMALGDSLGFISLDISGMVGTELNSYFVKVPSEVYDSLFDACREEKDRQEQLDRVKFGLRLESICEVGCEKTKELIEDVK